jgi:hypothetical protein
MSKLDSFAILRSIQKIEDWIKEEEIKMFLSSIYAFVCTSPHTVDSNISRFTPFSSLHGNDCEKYIKTKLISSLTKQMSFTDSYYQKNHEFFLTGEQVDSFIFVSFLWFLFIIFGIVSYF